MESAEGALSAAAALGPYFVWERRSTTGGPGPTNSAGGGFPAQGGRSGDGLSATAGAAPAETGRSGGDWRPLPELSDPEAVAERVGAASATLAGPPRAVASVTFLGIASRLVSPPFAALVLAGVLPLPDRLWWRPVPRGPLPIAYEAATPAEVGTDVSAALTGPVVPVLHMFADRYRISAKVMWGNVASALAGAAGVLADSRPQHAERAGMLLERVLAGPPLAGAATVARPDPRHARRFLIRHNCCLYYRIAGGGLCGDCVLLPNPERRYAWTVALARSAARLT